jgi:1-deoxyxylulose-5-phosphate synthase
MQYTPLGRTGLTVSRARLGCMRYASPAGRPWVLDAAATCPLVNFFDTADFRS